LAVRNMVRPCLGAWRLVKIYLFLYFFIVLM